MKTTEEILIQQNREIIDVLKQQNEMLRQIHNHLTYMWDKQPKAMGTSELYNKIKRKNSGDQPAVNNLSGDRLKSILKKKDDS